VFDHSALVPLAPQPDDVPFPAGEWPEGDLPAGVNLEPLLDSMFDEEGPTRTTYAVVVIHHGRLVAERYGGVIEHWDKPDEPVSASTPLLSWSMAKSMLHAIVGMLVAEGRLALDAPAPVPEWRFDGRNEVTLEHLLTMRDGLDFTEDYVDAGVSDVIEMLFGRGADDVAAFAADRLLAAKPGERFNYSSGTSNIISRIVRDVVGAGDPYRQFLHERLFDPIGMSSAEARFDDAGTWVASSYVYATARDFARFGLLYARDGVWDGKRLLPEGWVDDARQMRSVDEQTGRLYGSHWWGIPDSGGAFYAQGYEGQSIIICPPLDLIVVRLGKTPAERRVHLFEWQKKVLSAFS
jgi:CubicO group peptidase (beta-lactamase class C family)